MSYAKLKTAFFDFCYWLFETRAGNVALCVGAILNCFTTGVEGKLFACGYWLAVSVVLILLVGMNAKIKIRTEVD
jgi:hypothetical protein